MLVDRYPVEDVFARVRELADPTDPVLVHRDRLLADAVRDQQVRSDLAHPRELPPHPRPWPPPFDVGRAAAAVRPRCACLPTCLRRLLVGPPL
jgi:hypothetical protein